MRDGKTLTTAGRLAESRGQLGGVYRFEGKVIDEAGAWAAKLPRAKYGAVEGRPLWTYPGQ